MDKTDSSRPAIRIRRAGTVPPRPGEGAPELPLSESDRLALAEPGEAVDHPAGARIFAQGAAAGALFLLLDGLVRTHVTLNDGERQILAFYWPGDLFGLAEEGSYVASAEAITPCRMLRFESSALQDFLQANGRVQYSFFVKAMHEWRSAQRQLIVMGRFTVPRRLAIFLLDCAGHESHFDAATETLTLPMTRYDIADYLGTSAESVTRAFARLEAEGLIRRRSARTVELDCERLRAHVDFT